MSLGEYFQVKRHFIQNGHLPVSAAPDTLERNMLKEMNVLAYCDRMGKVGAEGKSGYVMLGYDDIYAIEYFYEPVLAYWKHQGKVDIYQAFERAGRVKRIGSISEPMSIAMCIIYLILTIGVAVLNASALPGVFALIFKSAFTPKMDDELAFLLAEAHHNLG